MVHSKKKAFWAIAIFAAVAAIILLAASFAGVTTNSVVSASSAVLISDNTSYCRSTDTTNDGFIQFGQECTDAVSRFETALLSTLSAEGTSIELTNTTMTGLDNFTLTANTNSDQNAIEIIAKYDYKNASLSNSMVRVIMLNDDYFIKTINAASLGSYYKQLTADETAKSYIAQSGNAAQKNNNQWIKINKQSGQMLINALTRLGTRYSLPSTLSLDLSTQNRQNTVTAYQDSKFLTNIAEQNGTANEEIIESQVDTAKLLTFIKEIEKYNPLASTIFSELSTRITGENTDAARQSLIDSTNLGNTYIKYRVSNSNLNTITTFGLEGDDVSVTVSKNLLPIEAPSNVVDLPQAALYNTLDALILYLLVS